VIIVVFLSPTICCITALAWRLSLLLSTHGLRVPSGAHSGFALTGTRAQATHTSEGYLIH
jgi:hypothetical protein